MYSYVCIHIYIYMYNMCIYIYIEREREISLRNGASHIQSVANPHSGFPALSPIFRQHMIDDMMLYVCSFTIYMRYSI